MDYSKEIQDYIEELLRHRTRILCLGASSYSVSQGLSVDLFQNFSDYLDTSYSIKTGFPVLLIFIRKSLKPCLDLGDVPLVIKNREMTFHLIIAENRELSDFAFILSDSTLNTGDVSSLNKHDEGGVFLDKLETNFRISYAIIFDYSPYRFIENKRLVEMINLNHPEVSVSIAIVRGRKRPVEQEVSCEEEQITAVEDLYDRRGIAHHRVSYSLDICTLSNLLMNSDNLRVKSSCEFTKTLDRFRFYLTDMIDLLFLEGRHPEILEDFDSHKWKKMFKDYLRDYAYLDFLNLVFPEWESSFERCSEDCRIKISDTTNIEGRKTIIEDVLFKPFTDSIFSKIHN